MFFDSHCHLDFDAYDGKRKQVWEEARNGGVARAVIPGVCPAQWKSLPELCRKLPGTAFAVGLHPWWINDSIETELVESALRNAASGAVAVGETGLDQTARAKSIPLERQRSLLEVHLRVANELDLPVILHSVRAHEPMLEVLKANALRAGGVVHSFSGSSEILERYLDLDLHISFSCSALRFAEKKRAAIAQVPANRLLVETDAPDQSADRSRPGSPADVIEVARLAAKVRDCAIDEIAKTTKNNAERLFGLVSEEKFTS